MSITIKTKQGDKQYTTVAERVEMVHQAKKTLEVLESGPVQIGDHFIWRVLLLVDGNTYIGNAEVHLNSTNFAEKADPWATAETSAVGRALAWSGYAGTPDSIASADEVARNQEPAAQPPKDYIPINAPTPRELRERHAFLKMNDDFDTIVFKMFKRKLTDGELTPEQCITISGVLERFYEKQAKSA